MKYLSLIAISMIIVACCPSNRTAEDCNRACNGRVKECSMVIECYAPDTDAGTPASNAAAQDKRTTEEK